MASFEIISDIVDIEVIAIGKSIGMKPVESEEKNSNESVTWNDP